MTQFTSMQVRYKRMVSINRLHMAFHFLSMLLMSVATFGYPLIWIRSTTLYSESQLLAQKNTTRYFADCTLWHTREYHRVITTTSNTNDEYQTLPSVVTTHSSWSSYCSSHKCPDGIITTQYYCITVLTLLSVASALQLAFAFAANEISEKFFHKYPKTFLRLVRAFFLIVNAVSVILISITISKWRNIIVQNDKSKI